MANTKVTGDLIASGTITADNLVSGTLDTLLNSYLTTNTYATQGYVTTAVNNLIDAAPASLDTLNELAAALNDDANFATTVTNSLATKLNLSGGTLTGALSFQDTSIPSAGTASIFSRNTNSYLYLQTGSGNQIQLLDGSQNTMAIFNPSSVSFSISNSPALTIDSSGNVGIGVTTVGDKLHVRDASLNSDVGIKIGNDSRDWILKLFGSDSDKFKIYTHDQNNIFVLDYLGNLGLGISNPGSYDGNSNNLVIGSTGPEDKNGITIVGGDTGGRGAIYFADTAQNSAGYITYFHSNNSMLFGTTDQTRMVIDSSGNVGIGTTTPDYNLEIATSNFNAGMRIVQDAGTGYAPASIILEARQSPSRGSGIYHYNTQADISCYSGTLYNNTGKWGVAFKTAETTWNPDVAQIDYAKFIVNSSGNVGIGVSSPSSKLHVEDNVNGEVAVRIHNASSSSGATAALTIDATGNNFAIRHYPDADTANANKTKFITTAGGGHFTFEAGGAEKIRIGSNGITFNGDTASANALDDYEEGTWTPGLNGYSGITYSQQTGYYTKIGRLVKLTFSVTISNIGTFAGNPFISGVPFSAGTTDTKATGGHLNIMTALKYTRDHHYVALYNGGSSLFIYTKTGGAMNGNDHQAGTYSGTIVYFTS